MFKLSEANPFFLRDTRKFINADNLALISLISSMVGICLTLMFLGFITENNGKNSTNLIKNLLAWIKFGMVVLIPLSQLGSMRAERNHGNLELLNLTCITPFQLVCGKFAAGLCWQLLLLWLCLPYLVYLHLFETSLALEILLQLAIGMVCGILAGCVVLFVSQLSSLIMQALFCVFACLALYIYSLNIAANRSELAALLVALAILAPCLLSATMDRVNPFNFNYAPYRRALLAGCLLACVLMLQFALYGQKLGYQPPGNEWLYLASCLLFCAYMFFAVVDLERPHAPYQGRHFGQYLAYHLGKSSGQAHMLLLGSFALLNLAVINSQPVMPGTYYRYDIPPWLVGTNVLLSVIFGFMGVFNLVNLLCAHRGSSWSRLIIALFVCILALIALGLLEFDISELLLPLPVMSGLLVFWLLACAGSFQLQRRRQLAQLEQLDLPQEQASEA